MRCVLALLVCVACGKNTEPPPPSSGSPNAQTETGPGARRTGGDPVASGGGPSAGGGGAAIPEKAKQRFAMVCANCHGMDGTGNGPAAANLTPKPRNYTDAAWQASVTDDELKRIIVEGGAALGKSPMMPPNPQFADEPELLDGLVQIIRGFKK